MRAIIQRKNGVKSAPVEASFVEVDVDVIDFNGNKRTIRCAFRLTVNEAYKFAAKQHNLVSYIRPVAENGEELDEDSLTIELYNEGVDFIVDLLCTAYGQFSEDGLSFMKTGRGGVSLYDFFRGSIMCESLLATILEDPDFATALREGLLPPGLLESVKKAEEEAVAADAAKNNVVQFPAKEEASEAEVLTT
jgi:hypothetical protein